MNMLLQIYCLGENYAVTDKNSKNAPTPKGEGASVYAGI